MEFKPYRVGARTMSDSNEKSSLTKLQEYRQQEIIRKATEIMIRPASGKRRLKNISHVLGKLKADARRWGFSQLVDGPINKSSESAA
jgi:hypothetical protein